MFLCFAGGSTPNPLCKSLFIVVGKATAFVVELGRQPAEVHCAKQQLVAHADTSAEPLTRGCSSFSHASVAPGGL